ncbi:hypothetical protein [Streptomyces pseudovenezuelae]|uniref:hypothetical protein n=1 Tax=Streptomyces pseudovenezuelae TaxID=67350 RepID=UPI002473F4ED|nr:hypothetical protein [Streptomyces pseudovenezuelae]
MADGLGPDVGREPGAGGSDGPGRRGWSEAAASQRVADSSDDSPGTGRWRLVVSWPVSAGVGCIRRKGAVGRWLGRGGTAGAGGGVPGTGGAVLPWAPPP